MDIKPGSIGFYHGNGLLADAIEYFDKGNFSHTFLYLKENIILESQYLVNTRMIVNPYDFNNVTYLDLGLTDMQLNKLYNDMPYKYLESKYDIKQILGILLHDIFNKLHTDSEWNNPKLLICSEIVVDVLYNLGYLSYNEKVYLRNSTPNSLYKYLLNKIKQSA